MSNASSPFRPKSPLSGAATDLGEETRKAVSAAFDAMADWRNDLAAQGAKNTDAVFDKMATAAKALGWPTEFVEMSRKQMEGASKMQMQLMDQVMDVWEQQLTAPGSALKMPSFATDAMKAIPGMPDFTAASPFPGMPTFPGMPQFPGMPNFGDMSALSGGMGANPFQFWMQAAQMWQKSWQQAMQSWMDAQAKMQQPGSRK
ncbi:MAG: hypothetical protein ACRCS9_06755 [Hyphomicrobium sp.]